MAQRSRILTDREIARVLLRKGSLTERQFSARLGNVKRQYRRLGKALVDTHGYGSPSHPFDNKDQQSVFDDRSFSIEDVPSRDAKRIVISAPAAQYVERGNDPAETDKKMQIRVKKSSVRRRRGRRGGIKYTLDSGASVRRDKKTGRFYLYTKKRKSFRGYGLLKKAVRSAFRSA